METPKNASSVIYSGEGVTFSETYTVSVDGTETTVTAGEHTGGMGGGMGGGMAPSGGAGGGGGARP